MQDSDIPEVLQAIASAFPAEARGLGLSEAAFVGLHARLLATERGRRAFGLAGVAREEKGRDGGNGGSFGSGGEGAEQQPGAFLGVVVVQGAAGAGEGEEAATSTSTSPASPPPLSERLRALRAGFGSVRSLSGSTRVAALHLARDLLLPEALSEGELLLEYLAVAPRARGQGVGRALLAFAVAVAGAEGGGRPSPGEEGGKKTSLTLWVDEGNEAALALYFSAGFRRVPTAAASGGKEEQQEEEQEESDGGRDGRSSRGMSLSSSSSSSSSSLAAAAMTLYHRALCLFFLGSSRWVRLALPLGQAGAAAGGGEMKEESKARRKG
jgi:ribosomal protein S18 acetylase RimI-like enzyme